MARTATSNARPTQPAAKASRPSRSRAHATHSRHAASHGAGTAASAPLSRRTFAGRAKAAGGAVLAWGRDHPVQATLALVAVATGAALVVSFLRHRQVGSPGPEYPLEKLVTSTIPSLGTEEGGHHAEKPSAIAPTHVRSEPQRPFRPTRQP